MTNDKVEAYLQYIEKMAGYTKKSHPMVHELLALVRCYRYRNEINADWNNSLENMNETLQWYARNARAAETKAKEIIDG